MIKKNFFCLFIFGCAGSSLLFMLSLVAVSRGCPLVVVCGVLPSCVWGAPLWCGGAPSWCGGAPELCEGAP